ncbi:hypothetical protein GOP47_0029763 [Adiantum capillus-veneris]|nr:hypothetical protein GOP47_0029763 [Adiantum capillus-veneris]
MSFLGWRAAASEGAFFSQTTKEAIARLREKAFKSSSPISAESSTTVPLSGIKGANADILPEILQHSLPEQHQYDPLPSSFSPSPSSLASLASVKSSSPVPHRRMDTVGLTFLPTLPQASFGPRRWTPPDEEVTCLASTANEARREGTPTIDDAKAKALLEGYGVVLKAFLIATAIVVGGATVAIAIVVSKLQIHSLDDIRIKSHEHMRPQMEAVRKHFEPWRQWVQKRSENKGQRSAFAQALGLKQLADEVKK